MKSAGGYIALCIGIIILAVFVSRLDTEAIWAALKEMELALLCMAVLVSLASLFVKAIRWKLLIQKATFTELPLSTSLAAIYAGVASSSLTPGRLVDFGKPLIMKGAHQVGITYSASAIVLERVLDMLVVAVMFLACLFLMPVASTNRLIQGIALPLAVIISLALTAALIGHTWLASVVKHAILKLPIPEKARESATLAFDTYYSSMSTWLGIGNFINLTILSLTAIALEILRFHLILQSLNLSVSIVGLSVLFLGSVMVSFMTFVPGGVGVTEVFQTAFFAFLITGSQRHQTAVAAVLVDRALSYYLVALIGGLLILWFQRSSRSAAASENTDT